MAHADVSDAVQLTLNAYSSCKFPENRTNMQILANRNNKYKCMEKVDHTNLKNLKYLEKAVLFAF